MRKKTLTAVAVALAVPVAGGVALAQTAEPSASFTVTVDPSNAGTKAKPKPTLLDINVVNSDTSQTASQLILHVGKRIKVSGKGLTKCDMDAIQEAGPDGCPAASVAGGGTANARAGVNISPTPPQLPFAVTAIITGKKSLVFYLEQTDGDIVAIAKAKIRDASGKYGQRIVINIPEVPAQQYPEGVYNGLEEIDAQLFAKKGKKALFRSRGCKGGKHPFKAEIVFVPNPGPPKAERVTATTTAPCQP